MLYIAHRGAPLLRTENTLPSFKLAAEAGLDWYELDVHLTKDGHLLVHHDYDFTRSAGIDREISELTLPEIRSLAIRRVSAEETEPCRAPTLNEVFEIIPETANVNIEIKNDAGRYPGIERAVADFAARNGHGRIVVSNFNYSSLRIIRSLDPALRLGVLIKTEPFDRALQTALELNAESINISIRFISRERAEQAHAAGLKILVWSISDRPQLEFAAQCGADGVFINDPRLKLPALQR
ncbi:MAG: glycerophosphodiester phosphodiesterase family protein [Elusimicrobiaceae bacterium]|nr:glycerophosphodiester phosphodiesterase family protein [Elusimicrobiaceae bacterium]